MLYTLFLLAVFMIAFLAFPQKATGTTGFGMTLASALITFIVGIFTWSYF